MQIFVSVVDLPVPTVIVGRAPGVLTFGVAAGLSQRDAAVLCENQLTPNEVAMCRAAFGLPGPDEVSPEDLYPDDEAVEVYPMPSTVSSAIYV